MIGDGLAKISEAVAKIDLHLGDLEISIKKYSGSTQVLK